MFGDFADCNPTFLKPWR